MSVVRYNFCTFLLYFIYLFHAVCLLAPSKIENEKSNDILSALFSSIDNLLSYFKENYQQATLDTVFGLRVIQGQCSIILDLYEKGELEVSPSGSYNVNSTINEIKRVARNAGIYANMAVPHLREHDLNYFDLMSKLTIGPWKIYHPHKIINPALKWNLEGRTPTKFSAIESEQCIGELLVGLKPSCQLTEKCLKRMLGLGHSGYQLQRQIFYTILAQMVGCERYVTEYLLALTKFRNLEQLQHELCSNAYYELFDSQSLVMTVADLFAETQFLCPSIGYFQFLRREWLDSMIAWQSKMGCFPSHAEQHFEESNIYTQHKVNNFQDQSHFSNLKRNFANQANPGVEAAAYDYSAQERHIQGYLEPSSYLKTAQNIHPIMQSSSFNQNRQIPVPYVNLEEHVPISDIKNLHPFPHENIIHYPAKRVENVKYHNAVDSALIKDYHQSHMAYQRKLNSVQEPAMTDEWLTHDQKMNAGCRAHLTWTTSAALAIYLRYLVDAGPPEFFQMRMEAFKLYSGNSNSKKSTPLPMIVTAASRVESSNFKSQTLSYVSRVPDFDDMSRVAKNYNGIYQRLWKQNHVEPQENYYQNGSGKSGNVPINRSKVQKNLTDWVINYKTSISANVKAAAVSRTMNTSSSNVKHLHNNLHLNANKHQSVIKAHHSMKVKVINIQPIGIQSDLDYYLVAIIAMSLICLVLFFRYFCYRKYICKAKGKKSVIY